MEELIIGCALGLIIGSVHNYIEFGDKSIPYKWFKKKAKRNMVSTYKFPDTYIYEGTTADGYKTKVMARSIAEAIVAVGGSGCDIVQTGVQEGMTITCE